MFLLLFSLLTFIYPFYAIYKPPSLLIRYFQRRWPDVLFHVQTKEKIVALTIDDAPSAFTEEILDVLKENGAKATFFVIGGQVAGREGVLKRAVEEGHALGNHVMRDEPSRALSDEELEEQIGTVEGMINQAYEDAGVPYPSRYFRPGSGFFSDRMRVLVKKLGYQLVLGDIYPHDPQIPYWRINARHILSMVKPGGVIICHDRRQWTVPMLKKVIPEIKSRGYEIATISGLLQTAMESSRNEQIEKEREETGG
ncbi:glycoside hydrolase/deacetylase [Polyplosphaeria fusca]|uniref:chitin deacetylase n=1 Tax=Polyplosphaeria fusca TaxID=682080 RepID=A0A9P4R9P2_9PLEO|nr:glycoside hydrolase/deacetylase [Polyplosphaeria fusca]